MLDYVLFIEINREIAVFLAGAHLQRIGFLVSGLALWAIAIAECHVLDLNSVRKIAFRARCFGIGFGYQLPKINVYLFIVSSGFDEEDEEDEEEEEPDELLEDDCPPDEDEEFMLVESESFDEDESEFSTQEDNDKIAVMANIGIKGIFFIRPIVSVYRANKKPD